jgi:hypothetical protein
MHNEEKLSECCNAELNPAGCGTNVGSVDGYCCSKCHKFYLKEIKSTSELLHWIKCESTPPQVVKHAEYPSLRDHFAMAALTGMLSNDPSIFGYVEKYEFTKSNPAITIKTWELLAKTCFLQADAMLEARKEKEENK